MDNFSPIEREQAFEKHKQKLKNSINIGRAIVLAIAITNVALVVFSILLDLSEFSIGSFISLVLEIVFSVALYRGVVWIRYFIAIGSAFSAFTILTEILHSNFEISGIISVLLLVFVFYRIASSIVLFTSKSLKDFLYYQKNG